MLRRLGITAQIAFLASVPTMGWNYVSVVRAREREVQARIEHLREEITALTGIQRGHFQWMVSEESDRRLLGVRNDERLTSVEVARAEMRSLTRTNELVEEKEDLIGCVNAVREGALERALEIARAQLADTGDDEEDLGDELPEESMGTCQ